jgi:ceramide glucosyltransferase
MGIIFTIVAALGVLLLLQSLLALAASIGFARFAQRSAASRQREYQPKAVIFVPCKGLDHEFEENLQPLFTQNYSEYELIFITENETDPAHGVIEQMIGRSSRPAWLVVAGEARNRGQKIHNLCAGIEMLNTIDRRTEVLVFADADARPGSDWLSELVAPLGDKRIGATTGFRWFVPAVSGGWQRWLTALLPSTLLAVWNSGALALLGERSRFAWGGSMAIRRENFDKLRVLRRWDGAISDDYMLTGAVHEAHQRIRFVPGALVKSPLSISWSELFEFTTRQIRITRIYSPIVWKLGIATHLFYNLTLWGSIGWLIGASAETVHTMGTTGLPEGIGPEGIGPEWIRIIMSLLGGICLAGAVNGAIRAAVAIRLIDNGQGARKLRRGQAATILAHALLNPVISLLYLWNFFASLRSRRIVWRGIDYEMVSPVKTIIHDRRSPETD